MKKICRGIFAIFMLSFGFVPIVMLEWTMSDKDATFSDAIDEVWDEWLDMWGR